MGECFKEIGPTPTWSKENGPPQRKLEEKIGKPPNWPFHPVKKGGLPLPGI